MYPFHLENEYENFFQHELRKYTRTLNHAYAFMLKDLLSDTRNDSIRLDVSPEEILSFLEKWKEDHRFDKPALYKKIQRIFVMVDAWAESYIDDCAERMYTRLNTAQPSSITGRISPSGQPERWLTVIKPEAVLIETLQDAIIQRNLELIRTLQDEHFASVKNLIGDGIRNGDTYKTIAQEISSQTGSHYNKAKFWARDQTSKFFGEINKERQLAAGFSGYIWRTVNDGIVRDAHFELEGTYHSWQNPPRVRVSGDMIKHLHPGEDYNCRCWAEPALEPDDTKKVRQIGQFNM